MYTNVLLFTYLNVNVKFHKKKHNCISVLDHTNSEHIPGRETIFCRGQDSCDMKNTFERLPPDPGIGGP